MLTFTPLLLRVKYVSEQENSRRDTYFGTALAGSDGAGGNSVDRRSAPWRQGIGAPYHRFPTALYTTGTTASSARPTGNFFFS